MRLCVRARDSQQEPSLNKLMVSLLEKAAPLVVPVVVLLLAVPVALLLAVPRWVLAVLLLAVLQWVPVVPRWAVPR